MAILEAILDFDNFGVRNFFFKCIILFVILKNICIEVNFVYLW